VNRQRRLCHVEPTRCLADAAFLGRGANARSRRHPICKPAAIFAASASLSALRPAGRPIAADVASAFEAALATLESIGAELQPMSGEGFDVESVWRVINHTSWRDRFAPLAAAHGDQMSPSLLQQLALAEHVDGVAFQQAMFARTALFRGIQARLETHDFIFTPTLSRTALPIDQDLFGSIEIDGALRRGPRRPAHRHAARRPLHSKPRTGRRIRCPSWPSEFVAPFSSDFFNLQVATMTSFLKTLVLGASIALAGAAAHADNAPIRLIIGFPPGGALDNLARSMAKELRSSLKEPVLVENRPGASTRISIEAVKTYAAFVTAGTSKDVVAKLETAFLAAVRSSQVRGQLDRMGLPASQRRRRPPSASVSATRLSG
jgi:hypothetical protein